MSGVNAIRQTSQFDTVGDQDAFLWICSEKHSRNARVQVIAIWNDGIVRAVPSICGRDRDEAGQARLPVVQRRHGVQCMRKTRRSCFKCGLTLRETATAVAKRNSNAFFRQVLY